MQQNENDGKVTLPVDIFNSEHLKELIDNPETYGEFTKDIIQSLGKIINKKLIMNNPNFSIIYDDFIGEVKLQ